VTCVCLGPPAARRLVENLQSTAGHQRHRWRYHMVSAAVGTLSRTWHQVVLAQHASLAQHQYTKTAPPSLACPLVRRVLQSPARSSSLMAHSWCLPGPLPEHAGHLCMLPPAGRCHPYRAQQQALRHTARLCLAGCRRRSCCRLWGCCGRAQSLLTTARPATWHYLRRHRSAPHSMPHHWSGGSVRAAL
jgi:hypothetical protein